MKISKFLLISMVFLLVASTSVVSSSAIGAETQNGTTTLETDALIMEIRGDSNVPQFFFWENANDTTTYKFQLDQIFEAIDNNSNGIYDLGEDLKVPNTLIALSSRTWDFSEFDLEIENDVTTAIHFNLTSVEDHTNDNGNGPVTNEVMIQFRIHLYLDEEASIKFDVVIDGYEFAEDEAMLVVAFKLITTENENEVQAQVQNEVQNKLTFGDAYFESKDTADVNGTSEQLAVGLSYGLEEGNEAGNKIYLAYEHFDGSMVHDPILGLSSVDGVPIDGAEDTEESSLFSFGIFATAASLVVPYIVYKKKNN